ncbi:hypothetical protein INR49_025649 [Caranx melampygus]|nr:hypothetical protein INR49_025649 [Caranx melampygus]
MKDCPIRAEALFIRLPPAIHSPLKLYLLISLSGAVTLFSRLMPRGKAKSDLPIAYSAVIWTVQAMLFLEREAAKLQTMFLVFQSCSLK